MNRQSTDPWAILPSQTEYGTRLNNAMQRARTLADEELLRLPFDAIAESLVDEHAAILVVIQFDQMWWELQKSPVRTIPPDDNIVEVAVKFPATGSTHALTTRSTLPLSMHTSGEDPSTISIHLRLRDQQPDDLSPEVFEQALTAIRPQLQQMERSANEEITAERRKMLQEVLSVIRQRGRRLQAFRRATDKLGIPLAPRSGADSIRLQPRRITLQKLDQELNSGSPEWHLEEKIAEDVIATIMSLTAALERLTSTASKITGEDEETIRDLLLFILNANYQGAATGETFVGQGKTDILLRWHNNNAFIGECKFWAGSKNFTRAIGQLLDRYTVWRDTRVALVLFIRNIANVTNIIEKANNCIINNDRLIQPLTPQDPDRRRDYLVRAATDEQRVIRLALIPVVVPRHDT